MVEQAQESAYLVNLAAPRTRQGCSGCLHKHVLMWAHCLSSLPTLKQVLLHILD